MLMFSGLNGTVYNVFWSYTADYYLAAFPSKVTRWQVCTVMFILTCLFLGTTSMLSLCANHHDSLKVGHDMIIVGGQPYIVLLSSWKFLFPQYSWHLFGSLKHSCNETAMPCADRYRHNFASPFILGG